MLTAEQNDLLTRIGPETSMGRLMRRYWIPALLSEELAEPDGKPVQVRVLGEELVAFRDTAGRVGLLGEHCSHRGSSLVYARNEECGLRCIYHGWKYDVDGNVLDTPAEPTRSVIKDKVKHPSYPTHEVAGVVWAYLGPPDKQPLFPNYRYAQIPRDHLWVTKNLLECSWLQGLEGECDSAHVSQLHQNFDQQSQDRPSQQDLAPEIESETTDFGVRLVATRKQRDPTLQYVRISSFVMPCEVWVPVVNRAVHFYVPINDRLTWRYDMGYLDRPVQSGDVYRTSHIGPDYRKLENMSNGYKQDREKMKTGNFSGIDAVFIQDACVTETMDYSGVFDRTKERLGISDVGIINVRDYLVRAAVAHDDGAEPPHIVTDPADNDMTHIDTVQDVFPASESWHDHWPYLRLSSRG